MARPRAQGRSSSQPVFVTGATGTVGRSVVSTLRDSGQCVVAGVRDQSQKLPWDASDPLVRACRFDFDGSGNADALAGCSRLFLLRPPAIADVEERLFPVIDAARRVGVRHVAFLSLQGVQMNRATPHHAVERYLRSSGLAWTFVRPNFFMQNLSTAFAGPIRERDEIFVPAGRAWTAFVDARDVGAVAATVLTRPRHEGKAYTVSGEKPLRYVDIARLMSEELGRPITYARPSEEDYLTELAHQGFPDDYLAVQKTIHRMVRLNVSAVPNRAVRSIVGRRAINMREFLHDYRDTWLPAQGEPTDSSAILEP